MGGSKKQTIGYKYFLGMHQVLCHGPIDRIERITVDDREAWSGISTGGSISFNQPNLFGGEKREGGVGGTIDIEMGGPTQGQNSYLVQKLGNLIPAYRRVVSAIFRQCYMGNNPYLKPWRFRGSRIHKRQDGIAQWYDAKAEVPVDSATISGYVVFPRHSAGWRYLIEGEGSVSNYSASSFNDSGWSISGAPFHWNSLPHPWHSLWGSGSNPTPIPDNSTIWMRRTVTGLPVGTPVNWTIAADDNPTLWLNGVNIPLSNIGQGLYQATVVPVAASAQVTLRVKDGPSSGGLNWMFADLEASVAGGIGSGDMNPVHIIRECLTDPDWGMGYTDADIDDVSFTAAANTLYNEAIGMSLLWDKQIKLEEFIDIIKQHIDAALYVSRKTGKFTIKLIRQDYDTNNLLSFNESNIEKISDPKRSSFGELTNSVTVVYWDRDTGKDASLTVHDTALVQQQNAVINTTVQYPGFTNPRVAAIAAQRDLKALSAPLLSCTLYVNRTAKELNIGDVFKLSWAKWGLSNVVMRITGMAYGTGRNNMVRITCVEDNFSTVQAVVVSQPSPVWEDPSAPPTPTPANEQLAVEAPYYELVQANGQLATDTMIAANPELGYVMAAASRAPGGINSTMWTDSGSGYESVGVIDFAPTATLVAAITKTQTSFTVSNMEDLDQVTLGTHAQIGDELVRVDSVNTETGEITVGRGVLDTVPQLHAAGDMVFFWDAYAGNDPTEYVAGEEVNVKITPVSGAGSVDLADAIEMTVELDQRAYRPLPPGNLRVNGMSYVDSASYENELTIDWAHRDRLYATGPLIDHTAGNMGPEPGTTYRFRGYLNDVLDHELDDIAGTSTTWTPAGEGEARVEVHSKRDGVYSMQGASHTFYYTSGDVRITVAGNVRATEQGNIRVTEG